MTGAALSRGSSCRDSEGTALPRKVEVTVARLCESSGTVELSPSLLQEGNYFMSISLRSHPILSSDAALGAYDISRIDEARLIRAAQTTLRREIFKHFRPGPERQKRLNWLAEAVAAAGWKTSAAEAQ